MPRLYACKKMTPPCPEYCERAPGGKCRRRRGTVKKSPQRAALAARNPWIAHIKEVQAQTGLSYKDAMKEASKTYQKVQKGGYWQQYGAGCRMGQKGVCVRYEGEDRDDCMDNPNTKRCTKVKRVQRMYAVRKPPTAKQVAALEKARAAKAQKAAAKRAQRGGYYWY